jgi:hypothetical protein
MSSDSEEDKDLNDPYKIKVSKNRGRHIKQPHCSENDLLPKIPFGCLAIGKSGSGKSTAVVNLLSNPKLLKDAFDYVLLYTGVHPDKELLRDLNLKKENIFVDFSEEEVKNTIDKMEAVVKKQGMESTPKLCLIFDDVLASIKFLKSPTLTKLCTAGRHFNCSYILCSQYYKKIPNVVRTNASYYMIFPSSENELIKIADELTPPNMNKKTFLKIAKHATKEPYSFLSINTKCDSAKSLIKGFNKVLSL